MIDHHVVLYGNDPAGLTHCIVPVIASAVQDSGAAVIIASSEHERAFRSALADVGIDAASETVRDRLIFLNANETLKTLLVNGEPDSDRFARVIGSAIKKLNKRYTVYAYGEMVGILRSMGRPDAAARLEHLWVDFMTEVPFGLVCGYPVDVLGPGFRADEMDLILTRHTKLLSALPPLEPVLDAGMDTVLGKQRASAIRGMIESTRRPGWATLGRPEATLLWLREHLPEDAERIVEDARTRLQ